MAKLPRVFQQLFGRDGDQSHFGQFGSKAGGSPIFTKDPSTIQALSAFFTNGWLDAINVANKAPFLEDMNSLFLLLFRQVAYLFQEGNPEWDSGTTYFTGSIVKKTGTFELYGSLIDNNTGNALPSQADNGSWHYLNPPSVAPGVMADFGGSAAPFGWLLCDGSVQAQGSYPALFAAIGSNWNTGGEGAGNFRLPNMTGRVAVGPGGAIGASLGNTGGEATHVLTTGEMPAHAHSTNTSPSGAIHVDNTGSTGVVSLGSQNTGSAGGGSAHNNVQPYACVNKIIKI